MKHWLKSTTKAAQVASWPTTTWPWDGNFKSLSFSSKWPTQCSVESTLHTHTEKTINQGSMTGSLSFLCSSYWEYIIIPSSSTAHSLANTHNSIKLISKSFCEGDKLNRVRGLRQKWPNSPNILDKMPFLSVCCCPIFFIIILRNKSVNDKPSISQYKRDTKHKKI